MSRDPSALSDRKRRVFDLSREYLMPARVAAWENLGVPLVIGRREGKKDTHLRPATVAEQCVHPRR